MLVESVAILAVVGLLLISFMRAKHVGYAVAVLPVVFIPAVYLITQSILYFSGETLFGARASIVMLFANVLSLVVTCATVAIFSRRFQSKRNSMLYLIVMLVFSLLLGWVYIYYSLQFII